MHDKHFTAEYLGIDMLTGRHMWEISDPDNQYLCTVAGRFDSKNASYVDVENLLKALNRD
jgi:hypothetical protein